MAKDKKKKNKKKSELRTLLSNRDNRKWVLKKWIGMIGGTLAIILSVQQLVDNTFPDVLKGWMVWLTIIAGAIVSMILAVKGLKELTHFKVQTEREGCTVEISMADSYITNAFEKYPSSAMLIGLNKCFWFREAEPRSLVADMWDELKKNGIDKIDVQKQIDEALDRMEAENPAIRDKDRPFVKVRRTYTEGKDSPEEAGTDFIIRKNYEIGTVIGVDLHGIVKDEKTGKEKVYFRKLFFIANAEIVQGKDSTEPIKVAPDEDDSVVENFDNIWKFFEEKEVFNQDPPTSTLYSPLLIPLIGGGVANEGYTDLEIFSKLVDLYYEHMRASVHAGKVPAVQKMIINIRNTTAIESAQSLNDRQIDMNTAKWYLTYRNSVNPPVNAADRK